MRPTARDLVLAALGGVALVAYSAFLVQHLPMGITRLLFSLSLVLVIGVVVGSLMKAGLGAQLVIILIVPLAHLLYEGIDGAKPTLSVIWYALEVLLLWIGLLIARFVVLRRHRTNAPAA